MLINQHFAQDRTKSLGGSDIGAILGLSKYRTAVDVWLEKTGKQSTHKESLPLKFGHYVEDFVAQEYSCQTGYQLVHHPEPLVHQDYEFITGNIDRFVVEPGAELWHEGKLQAQKLLECKTAHPFMQNEWGEPGTDQVPPSYLAQCHWYLMLTGCSSIDLAVLFANNDFRIYTINQDPDIQAQLLDRALQFWQEHVLTEVAPVPKNQMDCRSLYAHAQTGKSIIANSELIGELKQLKALEAEMYKLEEQVSHIKTKVMSYMAEAESLVHQGQTLVTWKAPKPSAKLDIKRLTVDHPDLVSQYQQNIPNTRRLLIKGLDHV